MRIKILSLAMIVAPLLVLAACTNGALDPTIVAGLQSSNAGLSASVQSLNGQIATLQQIQNPTTQQSAEIATLQKVLATEQASQIAVGTVLANQQSASTQSSNTAGQIISTIGGVAGTVAAVQPGTPWGSVAAIIAAIAGMVGMYFKQSSANTQNLESAHTANMRASDNHAETMATIAPLINAPPPVAATVIPKPAA